MVCWPFNSLSLYWKKKYHVNVRGKGGFLTSQATSAKAKCCFNFTRKFFAFFCAQLWLNFCERSWFRHLSLELVITNQLEVKKHNYIMSYKMSHLWNQLPSYIKQSTKLRDFCKKLKTFNFIYLKASCNVITVYLRALFIYLFIYFFLLLLFPVL